MPSDLGGDESVLPSLLMGPSYTHGDTCLLSPLPCSAHRGGCCEKSLSVVAAVVASFDFPLPHKVSLRRRVLRASTELSLAEESLRTNQCGAMASLNDVIAFLDQLPAVGIEYIF